MKLSILIPTIKRDETFLSQLIYNLEEQTLSMRDEVEILIDHDEYGSIGTKRNNLLKVATGEYTAFIDSDDEIAVNYISLLMKAIDSDCDCASLKGEITINGGAPEIFEHSLKYNEWKTNPEGSEIRYERYPNHLSLIRSSISKQFKFPEKNHGEDHDWSKQIHESGLLKTEYYIPEIIYYYNYISNK